MTLVKRENERVQERRKTKAVAHERPGEWLKKCSFESEKVREAQRQSADERNCSTASERASARERT